MCAEIGVVGKAPLFEGRVDCSVLMGGSAAGTGGSRTGPTSGIVAILDALGTKGLWVREKPEAVLESRLALQTFIQGHLTDFQVASFESLESKGPPVLEEVHVRAQFVSDSLIISMIPPVHSELNLLLASLAWKLASAFARAVESGVLYRGAVSIGDFYPSKDFLMGPAVDEAAEWYELADWAGIILTPGAESFVDRAIDHIPGRQIAGIVPWEVPFKGSKDGGRRTRRTWVINWPGCLAGKRDALERLFLRQPVDPDTSSKHRATLDFFDAWFDGRVSEAHDYIPPGTTTGLPTFDHVHSGGRKAGCAAPALLTRRPVAPRGHIGRPGARRVKRPVRRAATGQRS